MADQLQTLKLEISKNASFDAYERIAYHNVLGILKTENGMKILLNELNGDISIRESAVKTLCEFNYPDVQIAFISLLKKDITENELLYIFSYFEKYGTEELSNIIIEYIGSIKSEPELRAVLPAAFKALKSVCNSSAHVKDYLKSNALNTENDPEFRALAVVSMSAFTDIVTASETDPRSFMEEILKDASDEVLCASYYLMSLINDQIIGKSAKSKDEDEIFTYSPDKEDKAVLDIRVILGKMTPRFESFSSRTKIAFLDAMISCNHRELQIYLMKALTSENNELIDMTLNLLLANINKLNDPDKLFRNLISLSIDSPMGNELTVYIFVNFFNNLRDIRRNAVFKDKLYNYLVVTLETYFETYRKDFMIAEVIEKDFPENIQKIRRFILKKLTPAFKKKMVNFLRSTDTSILSSILDELAVMIPYVDDHEKQDFILFLEMLNEKDPKSREISAVRIEDVNFDKHYLKDRIIRLCSIIGNLKIDSAASQLVIIYNYLKKYMDKDIFEAVAYSLSMLNYSYMLGELEVMLTTGDDSEQLKAIQYISLFSDQRSLNIILDFVKNNSRKESNHMISMLQTLLRHDIFGNITANAVMKEVIAGNPDPATKALAVLCLGKTGRESDIAFLNEQFHQFKNNEPKEAVVQAIEHIIVRVKDINIRPVKGILQEYMKDPSIKIRIYSCYLLFKLGNTNTLNSIMDMMRIRNKQIQREIITIFMNYRSIDFAYFLISLLKEEYGIFRDIIPFLENLPEAELREIDHFIVNIFKRFEFVGQKEAPSGSIKYNVNNISGTVNYITDIKIINLQTIVKKMSIIDIMLLNQHISNNVFSEILKNKGILARMLNGRITAYFGNPEDAVNTCLFIKRIFNEYNYLRLPGSRLYLLIQIFSDKLILINDEIINLNDLKLEQKGYSQLNKVVLHQDIHDRVKKAYFTQPLPVVNSNFLLNNKLHELLSSVNFDDLTKEIMDDLFKENELRLKKEIELEKELREQKQKSKSPVAVAYAQSFDDLGRILKNDLNDVNKYIQKRSMDREMIANVEKMLSNIYKRYFVEKSKIFSEID